MSDDAPQFVRRPAAPALRPYVDGYIGYRTPGVPGALHRGLPSRHLTLIVAVGAPVAVLASTGPAPERGTYGFVLAGLQVTPALIDASVTQEGVGIELTPLGSRAVLGLPAAALYDVTLEAADVLGPTATELRERMHEHAAWEGRFACCDEVLSRLLARHGDDVDAALRHAWTLLVAASGRRPVAEVAAEVGYSRRHLAQRFRAEFGLGPKAAARVLRFERACALLRSVRRPALADVATACGYYDQPHLNRDFAALAGCSPGGWLRAELPFVQDAAGDRGPR